MTKRQEHLNSLYVMLDTVNHGLRKLEMAADELVTVQEQIQAQIFVAAQELHEAGECGCPKRQRVKAGHVTDPKNHTARKDLPN